MSNLSDVMSKPVNIPEEVPPTWEWISLVDVCQPKQWKTISNTELTNTGFPVFGANGFIGYFEEYNHEEQTIAVTCRGATCGTVNLVPPKAYITGNSMCLDDIQNNTDTKYLYFAVTYRTLSDVISGSAQPQITGESLKSVIIPFPPLPEQKKIASILTSVDEVIEDAQKQIDKLQDLKKATMNELLTKGLGHTEFKDSELGRIPKSWDVVSLSDLALVDRESLSSSTSPDYQFFYIDITSVKTCFINIPPTKIKYDDSPSRARRVVRKGDVLLSTVRPNLKAFAYVENDCLDWVCSTGFSVLSPKDGNDGRFIFYSVLSEFVTKQIEALVVGSNYPAINSTDVKSLLVLRPSSLSEQKKIASTLNSIDTCIKDKQQKLYQTQSLKRSLMQDLLTGKVRVKVN